MVRLARLASLRGGCAERGERPVRSASVSNNSREDFKVNPLAILPVVTLTLPFSISKDVSRVSTVLALSGESASQAAS